MIAIVALGSQEPPRLERIGESLLRAFPEAGPRELAEGCLHIGVGAERIRVAPVRGRIPDALLEGPCRTAWYWPEAAAEFESHLSQLVVVVEESPGKDLHRGLLLTRAVADLASDFPSLGVYWDGAPMVHSPQSFCEAARDMSLRSLPIRLWVDFRLIPEDEGVHSLATFGLLALGFMEIEIVSSCREPGELLRWAFNLAHYLLEGGTVEDDHTMGMTDDDRVLVRHEPSMFDSERTVYSLKL